MPKGPDDVTGPTAERKAHADEFFVETGQSRSTRRVNMLDDQLGRAWVRKYIDAQEYAALRKYNLHWLAGGLQGPLASVDLDRVMAFNPTAMSGLAKTERQFHHRNQYWQAHGHLGTRPAFVADHIACYDTDMSALAIMLGYTSRYRGREKVKEILADAGYRLVKFWA